MYFVIEYIICIYICIHTCIRKEKSDFTGGGNISDEKELKIKSIDKVIKDIMKQCLFSIFFYSTIYFH